MKTFQQCIHTKPAGSASLVRRSNILPAIIAAVILAMPNSIWGQTAGFQRVQQKSGAPTLPALSLML